MVPSLLLFLFAIFVVQPSIQAFAPTFVRTHRWRDQVIGKFSILFAADDQYSESEVGNMRELILSLSKESTDDDRRTRVKEVFHEALARPNGMPRRFTDLFDKVLIEVGNEVQNEAKKKFFENQALSPGDEQGSSKEELLSQEVSTESTLEERTKAPEELQLWALVDMMVQTKTIVKRENGDLGSKGTFQ